MIKFKLKLISIMLISCFVLNNCMPIVLAYKDENVSNDYCDDVVVNNSIEHNDVIENESNNIIENNDIVGNEINNNTIENNNVVENVTSDKFNKNVNDDVIEDVTENEYNNKLIKNDIIDNKLLSDEHSIVSYKTHVQNDGWQSWKSDGDVSGTENRNLRLEAINIELAKSFNFNIKYQVHIQNLGWQDWKQNGAFAGTEGRSLRLEAIKIVLESSDDYSIMYRVHIQNIGWQDWKIDGEIAGTEEQSLRLEAIQIKVIKKQKKGLIYLDTAQNGTTYYSPENIVVSGWKMANVSDTKLKVYIDNNNEPIDDSLIVYSQRDDVINAVLDYGTYIQNPKPGFYFTLNTKNIDSGNHTIKLLLIDKNNEKIQECTTIINIDTNLHVGYKSHIQNIGWQDWQLDGNMSGTEGQALRVEALNIKLINAPIDAKIHYRTHIQNIGWQDWKIDGNLSGTEGASLRIEAIQISLENMDKYTIEYQVHIQNIGWSAWYIDGEVAGTIGQSKRIEAIRIRIVPKYKREYYGIDISEHQKEIDFNKVVNTRKVDFIIARAGWYSESRGKFMVDKFFERNYMEIKSRNIPIGTYIYSYATNVDEAKNEANGLINYLLSTGQTDFNLPIFFDIEDNSQINIDKQTQTDMCRAFGDILKSHGFKVGIYSSKNWLLNRIDLNQIPEDYSLWVASYSYNDNGSMPSLTLKFPGNHDIWQYSSKGIIDGINSYVDMNVCYKRLF